MKIVAITACPSGIAHTYMSAIKLESTAKKLGYDIKVEKQGAKGIENELTEIDISEADIVIFAVDTKVKKEERFINKNIYKCSVVEPIKEAERIINDAILNKKEKKNIFKQVGNSVLTGFSFMIPIVVGATAIIALAYFMEQFIGVHELSSILNQLGKLALYFMLPIFSGYIAYDIADKPGLAIGFIGGILMKSMNGGFIGAIVMGLMSGYLCLFLVKQIKLKDDYAGLASNLIIILSFLIVLLVGYFVICPAFAWLNSYLVGFLSHMNGIQAIIVAMIIGGMMGYDLGGPINKIAMIISVGLIDSQLYICNTAAMVSICVPPLGYGIYWLLFKKRMVMDLKNIGKKTLSLGLIGISEGAIPFTLRNEKYFKPLNMMACALASAVTVYFGALNPTLIAGIYGWFLIPKWPMYIVGVLLGIITIVIGTCIIKGLKETEIDGKNDTCC